MARVVGPRPWDGPDGRELLDALIVAPAHQVPDCRPPTLENRRLLRGRLVAVR
jgi:hypothetical protein